MLWVTEQTVKFHLSNIYRKLDVANRTEASRWAQLHGLLADARRTGPHRCCSRRRRSRSLGVGDDEAGAAGRALVLVVPGRAIVL